jgi:dTDP-4-dehydrorhamnose 3,5-epimerase
MNFSTTEIPGAILIDLRRFEDTRGSFVKFVFGPEFEQAGLRFDFREQYYSLSHRGVLRGMHFQTPPHEHAKLVTCISGEALDVLVDLRKGSPSFGKTVSFRLRGSVPQAVYIPSGVAHGFLAAADNTTLLYAVTSSHAKEHDCGILWSSLDFDWGLDCTPILSARDAGFPPFAEFETPFVFDANQMMR